MRDYIEREIGTLIHLRYNYLELFEALKIKRIISKRHTKNPDPLNLI